MTVVPEMQEFIFQLFQLVFIPLITLVVGLLADYINKLRQKTKQYIGEQRWTLLSDLSVRVIQAAEQSGLAGYIDNQADTKREWAISELKKLALQYGITVDVGEAVVLIEAAVREGLHRTEPQWRDK